MAEDDGGGRKNGDHSRCRSVLVKVVGTIPLFLALMFYLGPRIISEWEAYFGYGSAPTYNVPSSVLHHFRRFDADGNGFLDPYEFQIFMVTHQPVWGSSEDSHFADDFVSFLLLLMSTTTLHFINFVCRLTTCLKMLT